MRGASRPLVGCCSAAACIYLLSPILMPFVVAALLAISATRWWIVWRRGLKRTPAVILVFSVILLLLVLSLIVLLPLIEAQIGQLMRKTACLSRTGQVAWYRGSGAVAGRGRSSTSGCCSGPWPATGARPGGLAGQCLVDGFQAPAWQCSAGLRTCCWYLC